MHTPGLEHVHAANAAISTTQNVNNQKHDELARAFLAAFKQADAIANEVHEADKKERDKEEKRENHFKKEDYETKDEIDEILEEIDKRLEKMLEIAKEYDA